MKAGTPARLRSKGFSKENNRCWFSLRINLARCLLCTQCTNGDLGIITARACTAFLSGVCVGWFAAGPSGDQFVSSFLDQQLPCSVALIIPPRKRRSVFVVVGTSPQIPPSSARFKTCCDKRECFKACPPRPNKPKSRAGQRGSRKEKEVL